MIVRYPRDLRDNPQAIARDVLVSAGNAMLPLGSLASIRVTQGPPSIRTENAELVAYLYVDMHGRDIGGFVAEADRAVREQVKLLPGYRLQWSGQYEYLERAAARLRIVVPATLLVIYLLLYINFGRVAETLIVMLSVPFALVGGAWLTWWLGYNLSVAVAVGFIALAGVAAETGVVMLIYLDHAQRAMAAQRQGEGQPLTRLDLDRAIIKGAAERVRAKMMTVIAIMAGLLPILWSSGAGPGGYVAAIRAAQFGLKTVIIERSHLGGICLNWGCIPTKALLKSGEVYESLSHLNTLGLSVSGAAFDFEKVVQRSRDTATKLSAGVAFLMRKNKIEVVEGTAALHPGDAAPRVSVNLKSGGVRDVAAKTVILATGARPRTIPEIGMAPDPDRVWTYREAMVPRAVPRSLVVIGSGAIGIEFASFYRALGASVTVVEALDRILPAEDAEVSAAAQKAFQGRGIDFRVGAKVVQLSKEGEGVTLAIETAGKPETLRADVAIVAIGIEGNVEQLGLEAVGARIERGHVITGAFGATNVTGLYPTSNHVTEH